MVGGDIQKDGDPGMERLRPLELEAAHFHNRPVRLLRAVDVADQGGADVSADEDLLPRCTEDLAGQGGHRRFAVRAGDGNERGREESRGEFELAQHGDPVPDGLDEDGVYRINARRGDDPIGVGQDRRPVGGDGQFRLQIFQRGPGLPPGRYRLCVGYGDPDPPAREETGRREPRLPDAEDDHFFPMQIHDLPFTSISMC